MEEITIQTNLDGVWHDAATLTLPDLEQGRRGGLRLNYEIDYFFANDGAKGSAALGAHYPLSDIVGYQESVWPAFLDDIMPAGYARRHLVRQAGLGGLGPEEQDCRLLRNHTMAPVGNLRVKESLLEPRLPALMFDKDRVLERHIDFVDHAYERGAASGGASGAGGEAPKYLVRETPEGQIWIDSYQDEGGCLDRGYLVKFARGRGLVRDRQILEMEFAYYHLATHLGFDTIPTKGMALERYSNGDAQKLSLWLPRFDMKPVDGVMHRSGLESVYSLLNAQPGSDQLHVDALGAIDNYLSGFEGYDRRAAVAEYLRRDLLNIVLGNSDNHCRNIAVIKTGEAAALAPVYDLAPMRADDDAPRRTTRWGQLERGGEFDFAGICNLVGDRFELEPEYLLGVLRELAVSLRGAPRYLREFGVPSEMLTLPVLGFEHLDSRLQRWGLL
ncbi:type II toxin-antitoxin system HipA family toxin [Ferrimonas marina]|uniref:Serine/threonine-protein kinase HipA n=1 Tax=Ferrimonas marina TaxID=299255 RepID=A0A1M5TN60_9GAMM|nr:HipA domain-containing protein [Ferrimonas marina]SHH52128.1 serine/threonine-protein kinase HipA [Ferrimonas marina]